jgi:transcriptional regulator with XRE-family HTH domain
VKILFEILIEQKVTPVELAADIGVGSTTIWGWRKGHHPSAVLLDRAFNALGYELEVVKK